MRVVSSGNVLGVAEQLSGQTSPAGRATIIQALQT